MAIPRKSYIKPITVKSMYKSIQVEARDVRYQILRYIFPLREENNIIVPCKNLLTQQLLHVCKRLLLNIGLLVKTSTNRNVDNQNVDKPKRRQTQIRQNQTSTNRIVDRPTRTSTNQNVDKPKRRQTKTSTLQIKHDCWYIWYIYFNTHALWCWIKCRGSI